MNRKARGYTNELRTVRYLLKQDWIAIRAAGSKGVADLDVLAYHPDTGEVKHIQSKSNGSYTKNDIEVLQFYADRITASNISVELWDWYNNRQTPKITKILTLGDRTNGTSENSEPIGELDAEPSN